MASIDWPIWLPPKLELPEGYLDRISLLEEVFDREILGLPLMFDGLRVHLNMRPESDGRPECFWHLVGTGSHRGIDIERAVRLPWLRPLLDNHHDPAVLCWGERNRSGGTNVHMYLEGVDLGYLVVLAPGRRGGYYLVTAHYRGAYSHQRRKLRRRFHNGLPHK